MYQQQNAYKTYNQDKIMTASPIELIIILYDEAIKQMKIAGFAIEEKKVEQANNALIKTQDIISELVRSLDLSTQIAKDLLEIYDFILNTIVDINMKKDKELIGPIVNILSELRSAWVEAKASAGPMCQIEG